MNPPGGAGTMAAMFNTGPRALRTAMHTATHAATHAATIRVDTRAWKLQVWISFALAAILCATGLAWLPGRDIDRAFMVMGYLFCLCAAFALSKYVRDNQEQRIDTPLWGLVVWGGFALAMALTAWGLWGMDINPPYKAYLGVSWLYLISSVFTLAKTLRDAYDAQQAQAGTRGHTEAAADAARG